MHYHYGVIAHHFLLFMFKLDIFRIVYLTAPQKGERAET